VIWQIQAFVFLTLALVIFGVCLWAFVDVLRRPAAAFPWASKRSRGFWLAITAAATAISFVTIPAPIGVSFLDPIFGFAAAVAAGIYLADVRPAVRGYHAPGRGSSGRGGGW